MEDNKEKKEKKPSYGSFLGNIMGSLILIWIMAIVCVLCTKLVCWLWML